MPDACERVEDPTDRLVDDLVEVVVELPIGQVGGLLGDHLRPERLELLLAGRRPANESRCDGAAAMSGTVSSVAAKPSRSSEPTGERDVVRVHERRDRQPRNVAAARRERAEQLDHLLGEHTVTHGAAVGLRRAVRLPSDPSREAERVQAVGLAVGLDGARRATRLASDAMSPSCPPATTRSAWETCHLPR